MPEVGFNNGDRTDETAEARPVRPEDHRHIAGKIDRAHRVRIIVNIRRMQSRFAAAVAGPQRLGSNQAHAGAAGVKMNLPVGGEKSRDIRRRKKLRRAVGAINHPQRSHLRKRRA